MYSLVVGIGAGLVSALLFGVVITGSPLAMLLSFIAPLPIFIASLGWQHRSGLVASAAGGLAVALALNTTAGLAFALGWAVPAWWLAYLALLGRPSADGSVEWYPLGRLLLWLAGTSALITLIGVVALGEGSHEAYRSNVREAFEAFMRGAAPPAGDQPQQPNETLSVLIEALPFFFALNFVFVLAVNLWLAARTVQISGRLPRPWPFIPATAMPRTSTAFLAAAIGAGFLGGFVGAAGLALTGALVAAFALQGLAFLHDTSRMRPARGFLLGGVYTLALLMSSVVLPLLAILGLADVALSLRNRFGPGPAGPRTPPT
jgi:hypothetical protein